MRFVRSLLPIVLLAVLAPAGVSLLGIWLHDAGGPTAFALFLGAVLLSAYFGGLRGGLLATALATFLFLHDARTIDGPGPMLFPLLGVMASCLGHDRRRRPAEVIAPPPGFSAVGREPLVVADLQGRVRFVNAAAEALLGRAAAEVHGKSLTEVAPLTDEQGRPLALADPSPPGEGGGWFARLRAATGEVPVQFWIETATDDRGAAVGTVLSLHDLTRQRQMERDLMDHTHTAEDLRRRLQQTEEQAQARLAAVEQSCAELREELARAWQAADGLRREQAERQANWRQAEERLRREIEALDAEKARLQAGLAEHAEAAAAVRREAEEKERLWQRTEQQLREEAAAHAQKGQGHQQRLDELQRGAEAIRREAAAKEAAWRKTEESLRRELAELGEKNARLQEQLGAHGQTADGLRRAHEEKAATWRQTEESLRRELAALTQERGTLAEKLAGLQRNEQTLRTNLAAAETARHEAEESLHREMAALAEANARLQEQVGQHGQAADLLRKAHGEKEETWRGSEQRFQQEIAALTRDTVVLRTQLAEQRDSADALRRDLAAQESQWRRTEERLRTELAALTATARTASEERQQLQHELQTALRRPEELLDRLSSTVRPMLGPLQETVRAIKAGLDDGQVADALARQVQRLRMLLSGAATAAHVGRGNLAIAPRPVEVSTVLERAVAEVTAFVKERGHHLTVALPLQPEWVAADADRLVEALSQLLDNAARYTPPGGTLRLTAERSGAEVLFRVRDSGLGIPARELAELQRVSARSKCFRTGDGDGMGIGLALARSLVELHGGTLTVTAAPTGEGSEVVARLPALVEAAPALPRPRLRVAEEEPLAEAG